MSFFVYGKADFQRYCNCPNALIVCDYVFALLQYDGNPSYIVGDG